MRVQRLSAWFAAALFFISMVSPAHGWLRVRYEDAQVVDRSELILVAAIKPGSIVFVPHEKDPSGAASWEHHAVLLVHEVIKGSCREQEIPVVIHYGLEPLVGGHAVHRGLEPVSAPVNGLSAIAICDDGNSDRGEENLVADARENQIWCLRKLSGEYGEKPGHGDYGIADPEDLQPLVFEDYLKAYLLQDPVPAVRLAMQNQPQLASRALRYLQHMQVQQILKETDPARRVEQLLPYLQSNTTWGHADEVRAAVVAAGPVAGVYLLGIYDQTSDPYQRQRIIGLWGELHYGGCVDLLIALLKSDDAFWSQQKLDSHWWNAADTAAARRRECYGEVYASVIALERIADPKALPAIQLTRNRWAAIHFENSQILDECDRAIAALRVK